MLLHRRGDDHKEESARFETSGADRVEANFWAFGAGLERTSTFSVIFSWQDVEALMHAFAAQGNSAAVRVERALTLASAVQDLVRISN